MSDREGMEREEGRERVGGRDGESEGGTEEGKVGNFDGLACHHVSSDELVQTV